MPYRTSDDPQAPRRLPLLRRLTVKAPCNASWEDMVGDDRVRHCCRCSRDVYDLTAMHPDEAEVFLHEHLASEGDLPCARLYRRPDGRVMTTQCPSAVDRRHRFRAAATLAAVTTLAAGAFHARRPVLAVEDDTVVVEDRDGPGHARDESFATNVVMGALASGDVDGERDVEAPIVRQPHDVLIAGNDEHRVSGRLAGKTAQDACNGPSTESPHDRCDHRGPERSEERHVGDIHGPHVTAAP